MRKSELCSKIEDHLNLLLGEMDYELVMVEYLKQNKRTILRIYIDHPDGITLNDCEKASKSIDAKLDELDIINGSYFLEVCSPGIERPLIKDKDFLRFQGKKIKVKTRNSIENQKKFIGFLKSFEDGILKLETIDEKKVFSIPRDNISKANLVMDI